jgi:hypothetical protein
MAQSGSTPSQSGTPSTFPQDQTGQSPSNPSTPSNPSAMPPDSSATGSNTQVSSVEGCLSQSPDGGFILADAMGNTYMLRGDTTELSSYLGKDVRVDGMAIPKSNSAGSMASSSGESSQASSTQQFSVQHARKIADNCSTSSSTPSSNPTSSDK